MIRKNISFLIKISKISFSQHWPNIKNKIMLNQYISYIFNKISMKDELSGK